MSIFGKDPYIKFCITMFSWQKMAEEIMDQFKTLR